MAGCASSAVAASTLAAFLFTAIAVAVWRLQARSSPGRSRDTVHSYVGAAGLRIIDQAYLKMTFERLNNNQMSFECVAASQKWAG